MSMPAERSGLPPESYPSATRLGRARIDVPTNVPARHGDYGMRSGAIRAHDSRDAGPHPPPSRSRRKQGAVGSRYPVPSHRRRPALWLDGTDELPASSHADTVPRGIAPPNPERSPGDPFLAQDHPNPSDPRGELLASPPAGSPSRRHGPFPASARAYPHPADRFLSRSCRRPGDRLSQIIPCRGTRGEARRVQRMHAAERSIGCYARDYWAHPCENRGNRRAGSRPP